MNKNSNKKEKTNSPFRIYFGKYKGRLVSDIAIIDTEYLKWAIEKKLIKKENLPKNLKF
jgi:uncharacterized protein (DUF3820 family)